MTVELCSISKGCFFCVCDVNDLNLLEVDRSKGKVSGKKLIIKKIQKQHANDALLCFAHTRYNKAFKRMVNRQTQTLNSLTLRAIYQETIFKVAISKPKPLPDVLKFNTRSCDAIYAL